jgi:hypothetical protein
MLPPGQSGSTRLRLVTNVTVGLLCGGKMPGEPFSVLPSQCIGRSGSPGKPVCEQAGLRACSGMDFQMKRCRGWDALRHQLYKPSILHEVSDQAFPTQHSADVVLSRLQCDHVIVHVEAPALGRGAT